MLINTALWTALLGSSDFAAAVDGGLIYAYSGPVPTDVDAAVDPSCVKLVRFSLNDSGTGLTLDAASAGSISKPAADTWSGTALASGTPTFFRWCMGGDDGSAAAVAGAYRFQGTCAGSGAELNFVNLPLAAGKLVTLDTCTFSKPA